ncbi:MAG: cytochrome c3 family protein [Nitrospirae bacterium]|nr:cytochrome c3 family protein [Nitrospirota bacterium]
MDDFRENKETLIEWQPSNALKKDTQGVESSEDICYSCHDGYVRDSRNITWKYNRHPVFVKPSGKVIVPDSFPLSVKNEIYCGTCHSAHGKGAAATEEHAKTSLFREVNVNSSLCEMCHLDQANFRASNGHPVHSRAIKLPDKLFENGAVSASDKNTVICQSCHKIHGAKGQKLLIVDNQNSELCIICHQEKESISGTKHDLSITLPDVKNIKDKSLSESGPCGACHLPHNAVGKRLWARTMGKGNPAAQMCLTCHDQSSGYKIKGVGEFSHPIDIKPASGTHIPPELPLFSSEGAKTKDGNVQCFTCHDIHRWDPQTPINKGGKDVEGDSSNSFLRISNSSGSGLCILCHVDKKQLVYSDHNLEVTAPEEKNIQGVNTRSSGPCGACHLPHNASSYRLWARNLPKENIAGELCISCHKNEGPAKDKQLGNYFHPVNVSLEKFKISTALPLFDEKGNKTQDGKLVCMTCHDPHVWNPDSSLFIEEYKYANVEGDATNSFLRKHNSPTSDLCEACHFKQAFVDGTDHDLNVTAPDAKNLLGQTVKESGQCGACHLVHNSPNSLRLWARPYLPYIEKSGIIESLCNSCHSKNNIAGNKIPVIATHPGDKLVNNIMRCDRDDIDYAPLFDVKSGNFTNYGNISCPTCHNAHQWSPLSKIKGIGQNVEGNATNSFLRNVSYRNICIDCHGFDALFRYKYFHDLEDRIPQRTR